MTTSTESGEVSKTYNISENHNSNTSNLIQFNKDTHMIVFKKDGIILFTLKEIPFHEKEDESVYEDDYIMMAVHFGNYIYFYIGQTEGNVYLLNIETGKMEKLYKHVEDQIEMKAYNQGLLFYAGNSDWIDVFDLKNRKCYELYELCDFPEDFHLEGKKIVCEYKNRIDKHVLYK